MSVLALAALWVGIVLAGLVRWSWLGCVIGVGLRFRLGHAVTHALYGADEITHLRALRVIFHGGRVGGQVDARALHAGRGGEGALDGAGAGRARHAGDRQVHTLGRRNAHAGTS